MTSFCYFCGKPGLPGTTCATCGIVLPDPQVLDAPSPRACPRCVGSPLNLVQVPGASSSLACSACGRCHGLFVTASSWCALVAHPEAAKALEAGLPSRTVAASELLALLACPVCRRQMERGRFAASSNVVVDVCVPHGMWLDAGELGDVVAHAAVRGVATAAPPLRDVVVQGEAMRHRLMSSSPDLPSGRATSGPGRSSVPWLVVVGVIVLVLGGVAAFGAYGMIQRQVGDVPSVAASASGTLR